MHVNNIFFLPVDILSIQVIINYFRLNFIHTKPIDFLMGKERNGLQVIDGN